MTGNPYRFENPQVGHHPRVNPYGFWTRPAPGTGTGLVFSTRGLTRVQPYCNTLTNLVRNGDIANVQRGDKNSA
jgi:hypothetical protein